MLKKYIELYLSQLKRDNKSLSTIKNYKVDLSQFEKWLDDSDKIFEKISKQDISLYLDTLKECSSRTVCRKIVSIKNLYKFICDDLEINLKNVAEKIKSPKIEKKVVKILEKTNANKILEIAAYEKGYSGKRNYTILKILFNTGIRREEITLIKICDIDFNNNKILINGKGAKQRYVFFSDEVKSILLDYLENARPLYTFSNNSEYLFISKKSDKICVSTINNIVNEYMLKADCKIKGKSTHECRKVFVTEALNVTGDIYSVSKIVGHESINTTDLYAQINQEKIKTVCNSVNF